MYSHGIEGRRVLYLYPGFYVEEFNVCRNHKLKRKDVLAFVNVMFLCFGSCFCHSQIVSGKLEVFRTKRLFPRVRI